MKRMPSDTVRGRVRTWIEQHADKLGDDVLEIGSRKTIPDAWWQDNRDLARGKWLGVDMQPGDGVDLVCDAEHLPYDWEGRFSGVLCSEMLEHARDPWKVLDEIKNVLRPDGWVVITTLFAFPVHGYPDDYWRFTRSGLDALLTRSGFSNVTTAYGGETTIWLNDHGEPGDTKRTMPIHVFAVGQKCCN